MERSEPSSRRASVQCFGLPLPVRQHDPALLASTGIAAMGPLVGADEQGGAGGERVPAWLVLDKPSGVLSVPGKEEHNLKSIPTWVRERYPGARGPITIHRLDMDTSGLLLVALEARTQRELSLQFERRTVEKAYTAVVRGHPAEDSGLIEWPIRLDVEHRPFQIVDLEFGRAARTEYRVLERWVGGDGRKTARLHLVPHTGRTHQLRIHCSLLGRERVQTGDGPNGLHRGTAARYGAGFGMEGEPAGHAILGDVLYGDAGAAARLLLHAHALAFTCPVSGERISVNRPAPF